MVCGVRCVVSGVWGVGCGVWCYPEDARADRARRGHEGGWFGVEGLGFRVWFRV